jgi:two-component SAPR family response regulator
MFFIKKAIERDNILKTLGLFSKTGNVTGIPKVFICTFGNMKIYITGSGIDEIGWRTNKAKELFAYLLNKRGEAASSEKLITELWPDSPPDKAKNLLYASIVHVKHKLSLFGLHDNLVKDQNGYFIKEEGILCDKWLVDNEIEKMKNESEAKLPEWVSALLKNNFMSDIYSDWVFDEQNKLESTIDLTV